MIPMLLALAPEARAEEGPEVVQVPAHAFVFAEQEGRIEVRERGVPAAVDVVHPTACRVRFVVTAEGPRHAVDNCPEQLMANVGAAADAWSFAATGATDEIVIDTWYAFLPDHTVHTLVAPNRATVKVHDLGVDVIPFGILALRFPVHPDGIQRRKDAPEGAAVTCRAWAITDGTGAVRTVEVVGCDDRFAARVRESLSVWQLAPATIGSYTLPVSAEIGVSFEPAGDGAPPTVAFEKAVPPDVGDRPTPVVAKTVETPHPEGDPLLVVHHKGYLPVEIYGFGRPEPVGASASCDVLLQVGPAYRAQVWPERCDEAARSAVEKVTDQWLVAAGQGGPDERVARFRGTWRFDGDRVELLLADADVGDKAVLPEGVRTWTAALATVKVPPRLPSGTTVPDGGIVCEIDATITRSGRPGQLVPVEDPQACPSPFMAEATRAVKKWRWSPAVADGEMVESTQRVRVRFGG
ncbi:MAG: hypothetical protein H6735_12380 [Alphaproteobacteria bacterium]|nr:hypothetical protein [Alphaproteobacteria bacterium]